MMTPLYERIIKRKRKYQLFFPTNNRTVRSNDVVWGICWAGDDLIVMPYHVAPNYHVRAAAALTVSYWIWRAFLTFDTSSLPSSFQPVEARLMIAVKASTCTSSIANPYLQLTPGHQSDPVVIDDFNVQNPETEVLGQIDYRDCAPPGAKLIYLNQAGLDHINPLGLTKYCLRAQLDVENQTPPLGANSATWWSLEKGPGYRPYLRIDYYPF